MKKKVCVLTGTRADYGLLREMLFRLKENSEIELKLLVTGTHLSEEFGNTQKEIIGDGFEDFDKVKIPINDDSRKGMVLSTGAAIERYGEYLARVQPDLMVILGDRFEAFAAGVASHLLGIPIAHISGGDITEGAVDDALRHCLTKMSFLHFPGCAKSAKRIIQMGEEPNRVFDVGEPGVENCMKIKLLERQVLAKSLKSDIVCRDYAIVTFHPVTLYNTTMNELYNLIRAMENFEELNYLVTMANADESGRTINDIWRKEAGRHPNWLVVPSLGVVRYLSALKYCSMVIGNSSSGIIEAPSFGIPTVNIGDRQKGRMMAESVICCEPLYENICEAINRVKKKEFIELARNVVSPFGNGTTSQKIVEQIIIFLNSNNRECCKQFYNL